MSRVRAAKFAIVAVLIAVSTGLTFAIAIFVLSGRMASGPSHNPTSENSQAKETVAVKIPQIEQRVPDAAPPPPPVPPPSSLQGLDQIPLDSGSAPSVAQEEPKPKAFDASAKGNDVLPWDEVEPVPVPPPPPVGAKKTLPQPPEPARPALSVALPVAQLPTVAEVSSWLKSKMEQIKGEDRARPLVHFEFWLEPPTDLKRHIVAVTYNFSTPAIIPQSQTSRDAATGFRIAVGGLGCADTVTVTLEFDDGRTQPVDVDGCRRAD